MKTLEISLVDENGAIVAQKQGSDRVSLEIERSFQQGDKISFSALPEEKYLIIEFEGVSKEALLCVEAYPLVFPVPFGEEACAYAPDAFKGSKHRIGLRLADKAELSAYRNVALNPLDRHGKTNCFPHASSANETRGESIFAARNAIDGQRESNGHGEWPYTSWGPDISQQAELTLDFGRMVEIDRIELYIRSDFPHDSYWPTATVEFSDGSALSLSIEKKAGPQSFLFDAKKVRWMKLKDLKKADEPAEFPALSQIEVFGRDVL